MNHSLIEETAPMPQFLLSVHVGHDASSPPTGEAASRGAALVADLEAEMRSANALVFSGRLTDVTDASVVRATNGSVTTTDGPYVEAKESIGGFYIVEAEDREAAQRWATKTSAAIGMPIEVRPFFDTRRF
jgi:hypothetical protein